MKTKTAFLPLALAILLLAPGRMSAQSASLHVVEENGPRSARINLVFLSEGYTAADLPAFATHVSNAVNYLFLREPWKQYRSYFNIYRIQIASNQSGTDNGTGGGAKDTYFESGFNTPSVPQLLTITATGQSRAYALLNQLVPEYGMPVMLVNDPKYGGAGGPISVASVNVSSAMLVEHESGHSFAGLRDEYDTYYAPYTPEESYNITQQTDRNLVKWRSWIEAVTPVPTPETLAYDNAVGLFEGAMYRTNGWYRPHNNSVMRSLGRPVGSVNREKFVLSYYSRVGPVEAYAPSVLTQTVTNSQTLNYSLTPKVPSEGPPLAIQWRVDGVDRSGATNGQFALWSGELGNGPHSVSVVVRDPTTFVRDDPTGLLDQVVTWNPNLSNQLPATLAAWRSAFGPDTANPSGDGLNNLGKYALGLDPNSVAALAERPFASLTEVSPSERYLTITIPRKVKRPDIVYMVRSSGDLSGWNSGPGHTVEIEDSPATLKVRDDVLGADMRYLDFSVVEQ